jgi:hypothetical protein
LGEVPGWVRLDKFSCCLYYSYPLSLSVFSLGSFFLSSAISYKLVLGIPCISVRFCINALDLRELLPRLGLRKRPCLLCLFSWTLIQLDCQEWLREFTSRLVCINARCVDSCHDLVCMKLLSQLGLREAPVTTFCRFRYSSRPLSFLPASLIQSQVVFRCWLPVINKLFRVTAEGDGESR